MVVGELDEGFVRLEGGGVGSVGARSRFVCWLGEEGWRRSAIEDIALLVKYRKGYR